jgi:hypothetical protein
VGEPAGPRRPYTVRVVRNKGNAGAAGGSPARETAWSSAALVGSILRALFGRPELAPVRVVVPRDR